MPNINNIGIISQLMLEYILFSSFLITFFIFFTNVLFATSDFIYRKNIILHHEFQGFALSFWLWNGVLENIYKSNCK